MTRFFIPTSQIKDNLVFLEGTDRHHLLTVLRKKVGEEITVLNGKGQEYLAKVREINTTTVTAEIIEQVRRSTEPGAKLKLIQGLPKADKFELIIQKNTELGVSSFQPVFTERSTIRLDQDAKAKKLERWSKIIREAAEQSGRQVIPELKPVLGWDEMLANLGPGLILMPWEGEGQQSLRQVLETIKEVPEQISILIGPEGGFSQKEVDEARRLGAKTVTLGPRILRTETAGLVVAAAVFYQFGDLG